MLERRIEVPVAQLEWCGLDHRWLMAVNVIGVMATLIPMMVMPVVVVMSVLRMRFAVPSVKLDGAIIAMMNVRSVAAAVPVVEPAHLCA